MYSSKFMALQNSVLVSAQKQSRKIRNLLQKFSLWYVGTQWMRFVLNIQSITYVGTHHALAVIVISGQCRVSYATTQS